MTNRPPSCQVLVATVAGRLLAIPTVAVAGISTPERTPAPAAAAPWLAGFVDLAGPGLLLAPFGHDRAAAPAAAAPAVALNLVGLPLPVAIAIDAPGAFAEALRQPDAGRLSAACPAAWLAPCRLGDGRDAALLDPQAVARTLAPSGGVA